MTNSEIYREWKQAKDPKKQVEIMADMENCPKKKIAEAIIEQCELNEEAVPLYIKRIAGLDINAELQALVERGLTKRQIAQEFGVSESAINQRLQKMGLSTTGSRPAPPEHAPIVTEPEKTAEDSPILDIATVVVVYAANSGKGEVTISANPDGTISAVTWRLEPDNKKGQGL